MFTKCVKRLCMYQPNTNCLLNMLCGSCYANPFDIWIMSELRSIDTIINGSGYD